MPRLATTKVGDIHGNLEVVEILPNKPKDSIIAYVRCNVCAEDSELFGSAIFKTTTKQLRKGVIPCGCYKKFSWNSSQYKTRVDRLCNERDYKLLEFSGDKHKNIKFKLRCVKDGTVWVCNNIGNFLQSDAKGCPTCKMSAALASIKYTDEERNADFKQKSPLHSNMQYWRNVERKTPDGGKSYWNYLCSICSNDEYFEAGLCSGIFVTTGGNLLNGSKNCRCSKSYRWTQKQREYQIRKILSKADSPHYFLRWQNGFKGNSSVVVLSCPYHIEFEKRLSGFLSGCIRCNKCAHYGFDSSKLSYLYVIKAKSTTESFTGYGITNNLKLRINTHTKTLAKSGFLIEDQKTYQIQGVHAQSIETDIRKNFEINPQSLLSFKREATYYNLYDAVVEFVASRVAVL